jgi:hypothetical protein
MRSSQQTGATVVALEPRRRVVKARSRRRALARPLVSLWIGVSAIGALILLTQVGMLALRHGFLGLGIAFAVAGALAWPLAGRWIGRGAPAQPAHPGRPVRSNLR